MASIIQLKRDISTNWTSANTLLAQGELGIETDSGKEKLGDGVTLWNALAYRPFRNYSNLIDSGTVFGGTHTINALTYDNHIVTLGASATTLSVSGATIGQSFTIALKQDASGNRTVTWFSGISWPNAVVPTLTTTSNKLDRFLFMCTATDVYEGYAIGYNI